MHERAGVYLTNALTGWEPHVNKPLPFPELEEVRGKAENGKQEASILIILGNPPYNGFAGMAGFLIRPVDLQPAERGQILAEHTIDLDGRRGMAAQKATRMRRRLAAVDADHAALRARQEELDHLLLAAPATGWVEAVAKARYLLILFAQSPAAEDLTRARLIADVFADFERLLAEPKNPPVAGDAGLAPASLVQRRIAMAKGQQRGNREAKKPKKEKPKVAATGQASFGLNPPKSTAAKEDRGKKK